VGDRVFGVSAQYALKYINSIVKVAAFEQRCAEQAVGIQVLRVLLQYAPAMNKRVVELACLNGASYLL